MVENLARRCGGFLKSLSLNGCQVRIDISQTCFKIFLSSQNVGDSALCTFSQTCCNIETLDLSSCKKLSDKTFHCLAQHCTKLHTLNISGCSNLTDTSLRAIGHGCPQLISLNLSWCELITQAGIALIAQGCRKLKTFISKVGLVWWQSQGHSDSTVHSLEIRSQ